MRDCNRNEIIVFAPPYSILFIAELEEKILGKAEFKPYLWFEVY